MKMITMIVILIYIEFFFFIKIAYASKTNTEINMKESIHFTNKISNIKNNKSSKKESPQTDEETNEYTDESETEKTTNNDKTYNNNNHKTSSGNINERKKFLADSKNDSNKNAETTHLIIGSDSNKKEKIEENESVNYNTLKISDIGPGPIFGSGWIKYFKFKVNAKDNKINSNSDYNSKSGSQVKENELYKNLPKSFNINMEYEQERRVIPPGDYNKKSSDGINNLHDHIQDKFLFYAVLMKDSINIVSSRKGAVKKTYETIDIKFLSDISENYNPSKNIDEGLQEYGFFSEGYCFKINLATPKDESFVICCDEEKIKKQIMDAIKKLRIIYQREIGKIVRYDNYQKEFKKEDTISLMINQGSDKTKEEEENQDGDKIIDGRWIIMQNWSQCTLKCGGGKSYLQRLCIPPKNGGKPCEGEAILEKKCNIHPCPEVKHTISPSTNKTNDIVEKTKIKIMPMSSQPLRYRKCVIKEGDVLFNKHYNDTKNVEQYTADNSEYKNQIPVRAVMNNMTFSFFEGEKYDTHIMSFNLNKTSFDKVFQDNQHCFILSETLDKMAKVCPFAYESQKEKVSDWEKDFNIFKYKCESDGKRQSNIKNDFNAKLKDAVSKLVQQHELDKKEGIYTTYEDSLKNIDKQAFEAIMQEASYEEVVKNKEIEMEDREEKELLDLIETEKVKKENLIKRIKEKALRNQYNQKYKETIDAMKNIKRAAYKKMRFKSGNSTSILNFGNMSIKTKKKHKKKIINIKIVI